MMLFISLLANPSPLLSSCIAIVPVKQEDCQTVRVLAKAKGPVHTNVFQKYAFSLSKETHRWIRVHSTVLMRFRLSTLKRSKTMELHVVTWIELYAHASNMCLYIWRHRFSLRRFWPSTLIQYVNVFVLIHFPERFHIDEFSMKTRSVLVWTEGLNASKCVRLNRKRIRMDGPESVFFSCLDCSSRWIHGNGLLPIVLIVSATPLFLRTVVLVEHRHC